MKIRCRKCLRELDRAEFATYLAAPVIEKFMASVLVSYLEKVISDYVNSFFRSPCSDVASAMAGVANLFKLECPNCEKKVCWDPVPEIVENLAVAQACETQGVATPKK